LAPGDLERALKGLDFPVDANVLVGLSRADDAGVYRIDEGLALVQTVDFFTPVVDDPYWFGQIAAANALSDVYAMGGVPKTALNIAAFPARCMDLSILRSIIQGGIDKLREAEVVLIGGHSIEDVELKYGLAITGFIDPRRILIKQGLRAGDHLILTKPLGVGIVNTGIKGGLVPEPVVERVTRLMATLNREAAEAMRNFDVHACTDITGFGFVGHLAEMISGTTLSAVIDSGGLPVIPEALELAALGMVPAGAYRNRDFRASMVELSPSLDRALSDILFDPQTSGGLLIAVSAADSGRLLSELHRRGVSDAALIGQVAASPAEWAAGQTFDQPADKIIIR